MDQVFTCLKYAWIFIEVLLVFNTMILVHEIGHFLAAKWRGLVVEELGIWFGKPLWRKKINGVYYSFGTIPFGGFVKLPQMVDMTAVEGKTESNTEELPKISPLDKIIVAFAGPLFSFGLACVFAVAVWQAGRPVSEPERTNIVGYVMPDGPADLAGIKPGDEILEVDGHPVSRFGGMGHDSIIWRVVRSEGPTVEVKVLRDENGQRIPLTFNAKPDEPHKEHWYSRGSLRMLEMAPRRTLIVVSVDPGSAGEKAGLKPDDQIQAINGHKLFEYEGIADYMKDDQSGKYELTVKRGDQTLQLPFTPGGVKVVGVPDYPNSPAKAAGLQKGDIITAIDGKSLPGTSAMKDYVQKHGNTEIALDVTRDGKSMTIKITPRVPETAPDGLHKAMTGIEWMDDDGIAFDGDGIMKSDNPTPLEQIHASVSMIVDTFGAVFSPKSKIGFQQMGGPVMMMRAYFTMLAMPGGWKLALWFSVILNVNLALLNMLPIPVLDGGHILLAIIEAVRHRPVNIKVLEIIQGTCAVAIIGFMVMIMFFDVQDLPFVPKPPPPIIFPASHQQ
ncbi:MAG TPA: site-2 protease family protein [Chthoniobacteraceae bacterium]|nr:site-2 protease family protein [Chthoniobacteraceae bacterium]